MCGFESGPGEDYGAKERRRKMSRRPVTTKEVEKIKELWKEGYSDYQIGKMIGRDYDVVNRYRSCLGLLANYAKGKRYKAQYTLYDKKGQVRAFGTAEECAKTLGIKIRTVYEMASVSKKTGAQRAVREELP